MRLIMSLLDLIKKFGGEWVALYPDTNRVVASDKNAKKAFLKAKREGVEMPTLFRVPTKYTPYIG